MFLLIFIGAFSSWHGNCEAGFHCIRGAATSTPTDGTTGRSCPEGHYCLEGTIDPTPCLEGTFNNITGLKKQEECTACLPGMYCSSKGLTYPVDYCYARFYCKSGAKSGKPTDGTTGDQCTPGHFCTNGTAEPHECEVSLKLKFV